MQADDIKEKICTKCGILKSLSDYYYHVLRGKFVPHSECKTCTGEMVKKYRKSHPIDKVRAKIVSKVYYDKNKVKILENCKLNYPKKKENVSIHNKQYYQSHRKDILEKRKQYRIDNKEIIKIKSRKYYKNNPDKNKIKYIKHKDKILEKENNRRIKLKNEVITHYGNGKCACVRCGFSDIRALSIDHINGKGAEHRRDNKYVRGNHVYEWLKKNNFPEGYQTLCMNCQYIKRQENHEW